MTSWQIFDALPKRRYAQPLSSVVPVALGLNEKLLLVAVLQQPLGLVELTEKLAVGVVPAGHFWGAQFLPPAPLSQRK